MGLFLAFKTALAALLDLELVFDYPTRLKRKLLGDIDNKTSFRFSLAYRPATSFHGRAVENRGKIILGDDNELPHKPTTTFRMSTLHDLDPSCSMTLQDV